jgi:serine protease Do
VKSVVGQLKQSGTVTRGWIGVEVQTVTQDIADSMGLKKAEGALVAEPQVGGPAAKAGIASGDLIQSANGQGVKDSRDLAKTIAAIKPGSKAALSILHNASEKTVSLTVEKMPGEKAETRHARRARALRRWGLRLPPPPVLRVRATEALWSPT